MARRKRKQKPDVIEELVVPVFSLGVLYYAVNNAFTSKGPIFGSYTIPIFFVVIICLLAVYFFFSRYLSKKERLQLVENQKHINDWFSMSPEKFEHFIAGVFEKDGYKLHAVTQYVADHGIDISLEKNGEKYAVQVKQYRNWKISEKDLREFYGSYISDGYAGGTFVTTSRYTKPARLWAQGVKMDLIDGEDLIKKVNNY